MQKITPFLWFDNQAEQAAEFYVSIFKNSKILGSSAHGQRRSLLGRLTAETSWGIGPYRGENVEIAPIRIPDHEAK